MFLSRADVYALAFAHICPAEDRLTLRVMVNPQQQRCDDGAHSRAFA